MILECCGSKVVFLLPSEMKVLNGPYIQELLEAILLPASLPIIKILGHSKLDSLEAKRNHLAAISTSNTAFKGTNSSQNSVMLQKDTSINILEKLLEKPNSWP